jgi:methyl-accepting chemotaxis protein
MPIIESENRKFIENIKLQKEQLSMKWIKNLKIVQKMLLLTSITFVSLLTVGGMGLYQLTSTGSKLTDTSSIIMIIVIVVALLLSVTTSWIISQTIYGPVKKLEYSMQKAKNGDLTVHSDYESNDELGSLSHSFNEMITQIKSLIMMVRESSDQVAASSEQLMASAEETNKAAEQIAEASSMMAANGEASVKGTEVVSVSTQQMAIGITNIADSITLVSEHSNVTTEESEKGNIALKKTIEQMGSINETVQTSSNIIKDLGDRSSEIEKILAVISGISEQTNLLALNAAIEAARAGEHGKGFAVVADEVRKLAEESRRSAEQITHLIHDIQSSTANAVVSMDKCTSEVQTGLVLINETGRSFEKILHSAADVSRQSVEVSDAVKNLSSSVEQVAMGIFDISMKTEESSSSSQTVAAGAEEQLASMEEITASAHSLAKMAEDLQSMVNTFKVHE